MKTLPILTTCLIVSVAYNVYQFTKVTPPQPITCPSQPGFGDMHEISKDDAQPFLDQYRESLQAPDDILGGIITRKVFEEFLCKKECNAIAYSFGRDSDGKTGPPNRGVFPILSAVNVTTDAEGKIVVRDLDMKWYVPRNWCPPVCN